MNVLLRVAWNRPEMLHLSIESEIKAREYYALPDELLTLFVVDYEYDKKVLELIENYPYPKEIIIRDKRFDLSKNILEGMKVAFSKTDDYVIYFEDDVVPHFSYFKYLDTLLKMFTKEEYSVLMAFNRGDGGINDLIKKNKYTALGPLISKSFFDKYIRVCAIDMFYDNRIRFVSALDRKYNEYFKNGYKYNTPMHNEQAGLINRLVDVAKIKENLLVIAPVVSRIIHIGYYGKNRSGNLPGNSFEERLALMRDIIDENKFYEMTQSKMYNDYEIFDPKLDEWDGELKLID